MLNYLLVCVPLYRTVTQIPFKKFSLMLLLCLYLEVCCAARRYVLSLLVVISMSTIASSFFQSFPLGIFNYELSTGRTCPRSFRPFSLVHGQRKIRMSYSKHGTAFNSWDLNWWLCFQSNAWMKSEIPNDENSDTKLSVEDVNPQKPPTVPLNLLNLWNFVAQVFLWQIKQISINCNNYRRKRSTFFQRWNRFVNLLKPFDLSIRSLLRKYVQ